MMSRGPPVAVGFEPCPVTNKAVGTFQAGQVDWSGYDCCEYYNAGSVKCNDVVRVDQVDPEKFQHDRFRYQLYAKPASHQSHPGLGSITPETLTRRGQGSYIPATTDVRALQQTMYIPIVPSNPGGETEVTFPMTPRTMGQPDVTTACCVPVIPAQPGFKNLTQGILPGPCQGNRLHATTNMGMGSNCAPQGMGSSCAHQGMGSSCASQTILPPSNVPGGGCMGLPDTFPPTKQSNGSQNNSMCNYASQMTPIPKLNLPHYTGDTGFQDQFIGGMLQGNQQTVNASVVRRDDRVRRSIEANQETPEARDQRLSSMFGAFGAHMVGKPAVKRHYSPSCNIKTQGNGFEWTYPKHPNRQCYVLERNDRG